MLLTVAVFLGIGVGLARGGRRLNLAGLQLRGRYLFLSALVIQLIIFSGPARALPGIGVIGPLLYLTSFALLLGALALNISRFGWSLRIAAMGTASNALAVAANGGYMPADFDAVAVVRGTTGASALADRYSNTGYFNAPALPWLTDWIPVPLPPPLVGNVLSIGDLLLAVGVFLLITKALQSPPSPQTSATPRQYCSLH